MVDRTMQSIALPFYQLHISTGILHVKRKDKWHSLISSKNAAGMVTLLK